MGSATTRSQGGSPPREWGQHSSGSARRIRNRFTPTRVGTAASPRSPAVRCTVHPHASGDSDLMVAFPPCTHGSPPASGDSYIMVLTTDYPLGSPPREWGQRLPAAPERPAGRFTPTRVGTALRRGQAGPPAAVHPHASGDSGINPPNIRVVNGSPPREWGQQERHPHRPVRRRFTPTRVGTAPCSGTTLTSRRVHPHASGDSRGRALSVAPQVGSPPREWGQLFPPPFQPTLVGFTPTRVGTASRPPARRRRPWVHPHASGDSRRLFLWVAQLPGSPPREWGQLLVFRRYA